MRRSLASFRAMYVETRVALLALAALGLVLALFAGSARSTVGWRGDYETGSVSQWSLGSQSKDPSRIAVATDVTRQGRYAARFEVRSGDNNVAGSGSGERAEVLTNSATTDGVEGREAYWAWSTLFPSNFSAPGGAWNVFTQFHHSGSTGQSNIHFDVRDMTTIGLRVMGGNESSPTRRDFSLAPLTKGSWHDFVFHVKWSSNPSVGFVEVWVNGRNVVPKTFTPTLYAGQSVYLKQGYYRSAFSGTTVVYHDGMRRGTSYDEVAAEFGSGGTSAPAPLTVTQSIAEGSTVSGALAWSATPAGKTVQSVRFSLDGAVVATDDTAPYTTTVDTGAVANGTHAFRVDATATDGSTATATATASVSNIVPLEVAFTVKQSLANGQTVGGTIPWTAAATGKTATKVEFAVNGQVVGTDAAAPFELTLDTKRFANGSYPFRVIATAADGTTAASSASVTISNASPTTFWVAQNMWSGLTLAGTYTWVASPSGKAVNRVSFSVDGRRVDTENHAPYESRFDTRSLVDGIHTFEVRAIAVDGTQVTATANVRIANAVAPPPPPPSTTLGLTQNVSNGQTVSGSVQWLATPSGQTPTRVEFSIDGRTLSTERYPPYVYGGDAALLDTRTLSNGSHTLAAIAFGADGSTARVAATVNVANGVTSPVSSPATATEGGKLASTTIPSGSTASGSSAPAPTPAAVGPTLVSSITAGQKLTGKLKWTIVASGTPVAKMEFFVDGAWKWTENLAPYVFGGDQGYLDATALGKGQHVLVVKALGTNGVVTTLTLTVTVA